MAAEPGRPTGPFGDACSTVTSAAPLVSVLVTAYNRETYIAEALESVLAQTMTDFEVVVCDDQSTDNTVRIVEEIARRDRRVRLSVNPRNLGDYGNRRHAASLARGTYLKYHDSDDVMYSHCLKLMVEALEKEPTAAFALSASHAWPGGSCPMLLTPRLAYEREYLGYGLFQLGPAAALFRTEAFRALGGFDDTPHASDYLFWIRACAQVNVLLVPGDLFYYRIHGDQELNKPANALAYAHATGVAWRMLNSPECPLTGDALVRAKQNFTYVQARGIYRLLKRRQVSRAAAIVKYSGLGAADWVRYLRPPKRRADAGTPEPRREVHT
jgi:glycosyltransferase involved in cell wall biosynthesis